MGKGLVSSTSPAAYPTKTSAMRSSRCSTSIATTVNNSCGQRPIQPHPYLPALMEIPHRRARSQRPQPTTLQCPQVLHQAEQRYSVQQRRSPSTSRKHKHTGANGVRHAITKSVTYASLSAIADHVGLDRDTVRKYVNAPSFPERQPRPTQRSLLDPFKPYILERWNAGCHTGSVLLRELEQRGYAGSRTTLFAYMTQLRKASGLPPKKRSGVQTTPITDPSKRLPSSRGLTWLVLRKQDTLEADERHQLTQLEAAHIDSAQAISLAQDFATIVRVRQHEQFDDWLGQTEQSGIAPLVSFAAGLRRDYAAVKAGVTLSYSNGPTEGHINRLKMLKRQMFGRAKLDLLKQRLMAS